MPPASARHRVTLAELLGAVSLATDLGTGQPQFHGVRTSVLTVALGRELGLTGRELVEVQQVALLRFLGCTADSAETARMTGGDDIGFLAATPAEADLAGLDPRRSAPDEFKVIGREIYFWMPNGMGRSKLTNQYFDSKLKTTSTFRNWKTLLKLVELTHA